MILNLTNFMIMSLLLSSTILSISSINWFSMWVMLELNMMAFIPIMMYSKKNNELEASVKYFLIQTLASSIMLMSAFIMWSDMNNSISSLILAISLMMKAGMAPFHMWYTSIMTSMSWLMALILSTWQKLAPLLPLFKTASFNNINLMMTLAISSAIVGGMGGLNQTNLRTLLAYSSIGHMGWMFALSTMSIHMTISYLSLYIFIIISIFLAYSYLNKSTMLQMKSSTKQMMFMQLMLMLNMLSLAGLPPMTGFINKWMTLYIMIQNKHMILPMFLIIGALINLYYYLYITLLLILSAMNNPSPLKQNSKTILSILPTMSLFIVPVFIL